jgi:putative ABC transport system permease protein
MTLLRDLRYGLRILFNNRSFAAAALAVLALGVGASTAVFSVLRHVLLTPLSYREPNRLVLFRADLPGYMHEPALTADEYVALRARTDLFESVAIINPSEGNLTSPDVMAPVTAASVSDNFFQTLGVTPRLGRTVSRRDIGKWVDGVDLGFDAWQRYFHGDPAIVGRTIEINNRPMTVAGVLPRGFRLYLGPGVTVATRVDIWYPRAAGYDTDPYRGQVVVARLRSDVTLSTARAGVAALAAQLVAQHPSSYRTGAVRLSLSPVDEEVVSDVRPALIAIAGAVAFVLLVSCANLTNLLLARASARSRELAVRVAIGASRAQIVRQLVSEGLSIGAIGAGVGLLLAQWGVDVFVRLAPDVLPRRDAIHLDATAALFAVGVSVCCAVVISLVPALQVTGRHDFTGLKHETSPSKSANRTRGLLVASQLALSLMLLVGAGLMVRAFFGLRAVPLGFDPHHVVTMNVALQVQRFDTGSLDDARARRLAFYHQLRESIRSIPGVEQVGIGLPVPLSGRGAMAQRYALGPTAPERQAEGVIAFAGYFETMRIPLVAGRFFAAADDNRAVIVIDQRLADELWPGRSAVGQRLLLAPSSRPQWAEVIGVVAHVQNQELRRGGQPQIWLTYATRSYAELDLAVRASNPAALLPAIERAVQRLGPGRPVHDVRLLDDYVADASADTKFALFVLGAFAMVAVALTAIGVYGVVAYATARRTREIAVRLALGADARGIVALVVREGAGWMALGLLGGLAGSLALSRYLATLLFHVGERDPMTFAAVALLLTGVALVATMLPARGALRVSPMTALRAE